VVLLTQEHCAACRVVENDPKYGLKTLRRLRNFVLVDVEKHPELAKNLSGGRTPSTPKLCLFWKHENGWVLERYTGADKIRAYIRTKVYPRKKAPDPCPSGT
jgi:hypothetical protein